MFLVKIFIFLVKRFGKCLNLEQKLFYDGYVFVIPYKLINEGYFLVKIRRIIAYFLFQWNFVCVCVYLN